MPKRLANKRTFFNIQSGINLILIQTEYSTESWEWRLVLNAYPAPLTAPYEHRVVAVFRTQRLKAQNPICAQRYYDQKTHSNRQQLLSYRYYTLNTIKISSILVKEKAASRSGISPSMHVVVKTRYENPKIHVRRSKDHVRRSSLSATRPLLLLVLIGGLSTAVSSFSFAETNHH